MPASSSLSPTTPLLAQSTDGSLGDADDYRNVNLQETWHFIRPYITPSTPRLRLLAILSLLCELSRRLVSLLQPYAYKLAVDTLSVDIISTAFIRVPCAALLLYIFAKLAATLLEGLQQITYSIVETDCTKRFIVDLYDHLLGLSLAFHLERKTGEVAKVIDRGSESMDTIAHAALFTVFPTLVEASTIVFIFLRLGTIYIAVTIFSTMLLYSAFTVCTTTWRNKFRIAMNEAEDHAEEKAIDKLINYETVKIFGMEKDEVAALESLEEGCCEKFIWFRFSLAALRFGQETVQGLGLGLAMVFAARATASKLLTPGDFVLIVSLITQLFEPLSRLASSFREITQATTDLDRCIRIFRTESTVRDTENASNLCFNTTQKCEHQPGEIIFDNVSFKYTSDLDDGASGIENISFRATPGKTVALVGSSGSGKSTIMRLLLRFYDVDSGRVLINGRDVRSIKQQSLRKEIGVVAQDTMLFNDTLRYNISYGSPESTEYDVLKAARSAALGSLVDSLPLGLDTVVGELGVRLSGGEKQRVGYARCIIKNPSIILLDEASSSLDTITEKQMQANLEKGFENRTIVMVAHRLSTVMWADEILVIGQKDGSQGSASIVERGKHGDLLATGGTYARMWKAQSFPHDQDCDMNDRVRPKQVH